MKILFTAALGLTILLMSSAASAGAAEREDVIDLIDSIPSPVEEVSLVWSGRLVDDEQKALGTVDLYDDSGTVRPVDYIEVFDTDGGLVAIGWFDRFGIERMAVRGGFLGPSGELGQTFLVFVDGQEL